MTHSFWQGNLAHLAKDLETNEAIVSMRESVRQSIANFSIRASSQCDLPKGNSVLGQVHGVTLDNQDTLDQPDASGVRWQHSNVDEEKKITGVAKEKILKRSISAW